MSKRANAEEVSVWVLALLHRHGIKTHSLGPDVGLLNVPAKWCAIVSDLSTALAQVAEEGTLPIIRPRARGNTQPSPPHVHDGNPNCPGCNHDDAQPSPEEPAR